MVCFSLQSCGHLAHLLLGLWLGSALWQGEGGPRKLLGLKGPHFDNNVPPLTPMKLGLSNWINPVMELELLVSSHTPEVPLEHNFGEDQAFTMSF